MSTKDWATSKIKQQSIIFLFLYILHTIYNLLKIGTMQEHYEHCVPKMEKFAATTRKVLVFRHGVFRKCKDNGGNVVPDNQRKVWFGHPNKKMYHFSRRELSDLNIHE